MHIGYSVMAGLDPAFSARDPRVSRRSPGDGGM